MKGNILNYLEIPTEILTPVYDQKIQEDFFVQENVEGVWSPEERDIHLVMANLPNVLDWLHGQDQPQVLEKKACAIPLLLFDQKLSFEKLLFHYDGTPASAKIIHGFLEKFELHIKDSQATIISPSFIPKSKLQEEQALIQLIRSYTSETSFIKFNFRKIGDFWSYATKNESTMLVTTKDYQSDLAKVLFHFYKGGFWCDNLSFYLA